MPICPVTKLAARTRLRREYGFSRERAERVLNIAWEFDSKAEPCEGGYVHVYYNGRGGIPNRPDLDREHMFTITDHRMTPDERREFAARRKGLAQPAEKSYTQHKQTRPSGGSRRGKDTKMARTAAAAKPATRGRRPAPEPELNGDEMNDAERGEAAQRYLTKPFTPTMEDYVEWFETYVSPLADLKRDPARILVLGIQLYGLYFQKSPFNRERTAERRAERASAAQPEAPAPNGRARGRKPAAAATEPARPASRGRGRTAKAADEPATPAPRRGRPPGSGTKASTAKASTATKDAPASGRGRGRPSAKAAASGSKDSPF